MELHRELRRAADLQPALPNRPRVLLRSVVSVDLDIAKPGQMSGDHAAQRPATYNADFHALNILSG
jgi:hypothetical protein